MAGALARVVRTEAGFTNSAAGDPLLANLGSPARATALVLVSSRPTACKQSLRSLGGALGPGSVQTFQSQHYAFAVTDEELDAILVRINAAGLIFSADPQPNRQGGLNDYNGGACTSGTHGRNPELLTLP